MVISIEVSEFTEVSWFLYNRNSTEILKCSFKSTICLGTRVFQRNGLPMQWKSSKIHHTLHCKVIDETNSWTQMELWYQTNIFMASLMQNHSILFPHQLLLISFIFPSKSTNPTKTSSNYVIVKIFPQFNWCAYTNMIYIRVHPYLHPCGRIDRTVKTLTHLKQCAVLLEYRHIQTA